MESKKVLSKVISKTPGESVTSTEIINEMKSTSASIPDTDIPVAL